MPCGALPHRHPAGRTRGDLLALAGDLEETSFSDVIRRLAASRESALVLVRLGGPEGAPDGAFHFDGGDLVAGRLGGDEGREALRRALRLPRGSFRVEPGRPAPDASGADRARWAEWVLEELVELDGEDRGRRAARARHGATTPPPAPAPDAVAPPAPAPRLATAPAPPAAPRRRGRDVTWLVFAGVGGAVSLAIVALVLVLLSPAAQRADDAVQTLLAPAAPVAPRRAGDAELLLGMTGPFTGANRALGRGMRAGLEAAFAEVNAAGGVHGRTLRLAVADDGYEPTRTGDALRELVERKEVFALVGSVGTPTAAVALPYCVANGVLLFGPYTGGDLLRRDPPDRVVFHYRPSYGDETAAAVRWLVRQRRIEPARIALFAQEDEFGAAGARGALRQLSAYGVAEGAVLRVGYRRNGDDVAEAVAALRARAGAVDAVVMVATYPAAAAFLRETRAAGLALHYTNVSAADSAALSFQLAAAGPRAPRDVLVTQVVPPPSSGAPVERRFLAAIERFAPGERPGPISLEGYVVGSLLVEGLRRAGRDVDTARLVSALEGIRDLDLGLGTPLSFGPHQHQASRKVWGSLLQPDGSSQAVELP